MTARAVSSSGGAAHQSEGGKGNRRPARARGQEVDEPTYTPLARSPAGPKRPSPRGLSTLRLSVCDESTDRSSSGGSQPSFRSVSSTIFLRDSTALSRLEANERTRSPSASTSEALGSCKNATRGSIAVSPIRTRDE